MKPPWIDQGWLMIVRSVANRGVHPPPATSRPSLPPCIVAAPHPCTRVKSSPTILQSPLSHFPFLLSVNVEVARLPPPLRRRINHPRLPPPPFPLLSCPSLSLYHRQLCPNPSCATTIATTTNLGNSTHPRILPIPRGHGHHFR